MKIQLIEKSRRPTACAAFAGHCLIASGELSDVALKVKAAISPGKHGPVLIFDNLTGEQIEIDLRGAAKDVLARIEKMPSRGDSEAGNHAPPIAAPGPGRPKLGVVAREVTLLPRHWEWLSRQPGGASVTLRKLVEAAKRAGAGQDRARMAQEAAYRFMVAIAGNLPGFEEATRVLFAKDAHRLKAFEKEVRDWPHDVRRHAIMLVKEAIRLEGECGGS